MHGKVTDPVALLGRAALKQLDAQASVAPPDEAKRYSTVGFGAVFAEVGVAPDLGTIRVTRVIGAYDAGRIVNPRLARGQALGGMIGGIGMALFEEAEWDERLGRVANATLAEYLVPVKADVHELDAIFVDSAEPVMNPLGVKGCAELGLCGVAPAIANAIWHATGKRMRDLPITSAKLLMAELRGDMMRPPLLPPDRLTPEQRKLYDRNQRQIAKGFTALRTQREDGALLGPWCVSLHEPAVGEAHYDVIDAVTELKRLSEAAKQVAIIVMGARFGAAYELYAHVAIAAEQGINSARLATLAAGLRPPDLTPDEAAAYEVATVLARGGVLPGATYQAALDVLGQGALNELILWVSTYASVSIVLNAYDVASEQEFGA